MQYATCIICDNVNSVDVKTDTMSVSSHK